MRRLFGVLRSDDAGPLEPQPGLAQLPGLISRLATAGLPVTVETADDDAHGLQLSPALDVTAFRIVQEALTNVLRHSGASCAWVRVRRSDHSLVIEVEDDGTGAAVEPDRSDGRGLVGIRERAQVFGGRAEVGSTGRGFLVRVTLPLETRG